MSRAFHRRLMTASRSGARTETSRWKRERRHSPPGETPGGSGRDAGTRSELVLTNGTTALHDKMLDRREGVLPEHFERIHKSYIVDVRRIARLVTSEGSRYSVVLRDGTTLPVGRTRVAAVRARVG